MSRTQKGAKGPGWEPWSNRHEKAEQKADYVEPEASNREDDICPGCRDCECRLCGGPIVVSASLSAPHCLTCGHLPDQAVIGEDPE